MTDRGNDDAGLFAVGPRKPDPMIGRRDGSGRARSLMWMALFGILAAVIALIAYGVAESLLTGRNPERAAGGVFALAVAAIALLLGSRSGRRSRTQSDRLVQRLSSRVREHRTVSVEGGLLTTFVLDNDLVLQAGDSNVPFFFSGYFSGGPRPLPIRLSDVQRWDAGVGFFRRETRHLERDLDPLIAAEVESLRHRLGAKSARLSLRVPRRSRPVDAAGPRGMLRFHFDPRDHDQIAELLISSVDSVQSLLERAWARWSASGPSPVQPQVR